MKIYLNDAGHMTKMAAMPIYIEKKLQKSSLKPGADFYQTWYVASGTPDRHSLFK